MKRKKNYFYNKYTDDSFNFKWKMDNCKFMLNIKAVVNNKLIDCKTNT